MVQKYKYRLKQFKIHFWIVNHHNKLYGSRMNVFFHLCVSLAPTSNFS